MLLVETVCPLLEHPMGSVVAALTSAPLLPAACSASSQHQPCAKGNPQVLCLYSFWCWALHFKFLLGNVNKL